ncbi:tripartite motif-containing protein 66 [Neosynchiropus ocellatus]
MLERVNLGLIWSLTRFLSVDAHSSCCFGTQLLAPALPLSIPTPQSGAMEKSCSECSETTLAQSLCTLCNKWLCYQCTDLHQHQPNAPQYADLHEAQISGAGPNPELNLLGSNSLPPGQGPGSYPCSMLRCHSHRQEPLELFCESCDLLCCSICHLSSHKNHRVVQVGSALHDQRWLLQNLMLQVEERRAAVENNAKQIEDRVHGVKVAHRKAENQIKMAKMIMMNELNKRANLLIEQLEKISEDFQQRLEEQLQRAIETCGQLDHVQKFITWATTHHCRGPLIFSRTLISLQMQHLLESSLHPDAWNPVKIKFNWDASYWTKQVSDLGLLTVEGGNCSRPQGLPSSSILRPQPLTCLSLPPGCHRPRESGCGYQTCCEPQICCLHGFPSQLDRSTVEKSQQGAALYNSGCLQPSLLSASLQRCWDQNTSSSLQTSSHCSGSVSPIPLHGTRSAAVQSQAKHHLCHQEFPDSHSLLAAEHLGLNQNQALVHNHGKLSTSSSAGQEVTAEKQWEERTEESRGESAGVEHEDSLDEDPRRGDKSPIRPQQHTAALKEGTKPPIRGHRDGRRSTSLEVSVTDCRSGADVQRNRPGLTSACARRKQRSLSIPSELAAASISVDTEKPTGQAPPAGAERKCARVDQSRRRASDGVLCVTKPSSDSVATRGSRSPLLSYKTEPDADYEATEGSRVSRRSPIIRENVKDAGRQRVPVVCLERLKILVSQLPPHGRRQSDPSSASTAEKNQNTCHEERSPWVSPRRTPPVESSAERNTSTQSSHYGRFGSIHSSPRPSADDHYAPEVELDSDPDSGSVSEVASQPGPVVDAQLDTDASSESDQNADSVSEAESPAEEKSAGKQPCKDPELPSLEYESGSESDDGRGQESGDGSEVQPDSDISSHPHPDSPNSPESGLDIGSDVEEVTNDEPQPLRSDLEDDSPFGPGHRPLLIANPVAQWVTDSQNGGQDNPENESEDFCAVCMIGGDLLCCDRCPKVFHLSCHVPPLRTFPSGDWLCSLCRDVDQPEVEYDCDKSQSSWEHSSRSGLSACDQRKCERLTLLILSNILSAPFHEPVSPLARHYYQIIKKPMDLSVIRAKLHKKNPHHYHSAEQFVADVHLMFHNCAKFNYPDSEVAQAGRSLAVFFTSKLADVFPARDFPSLRSESESDEYDEACRTADGGFPWPERREQSYRKRKRRHSLRSRRHHF